MSRAVDPRMRAALVGLVSIVGCRTPTDSAPFDEGAQTGLSFESPLLSPGKLDTLYRSRPDSDEANVFLWTPLMKGGAGTFDPDQAEETRYAGGYVRPLQAWQGAGELVVGGLTVDAPGERSEEIQAEYRFPFGLGLGGGSVDRPGSDRDVQFAKLTFRDRVGDWNYIVEGQLQEVGHDTDPGGYLAVYDPERLCVYGNDGEQWRATMSYTAPRDDGELRPAIEGLYVDNSIGDVDGPRFLFVNGTLQYRGGFLSHPAALGRAMGPQGLEFGNPLGFLRPTWNRRLNTWELGGVLDLRVVRTEFPDGSIVADYEVVAFPAQLDDVDSPLNGLLVGVFRADLPDDDVEGVTVGYAGRVGFLSTSIVLRWEIDTQDATVVVSLIDWFS